jgi:SAM-dependent methyltransferase
MGSTTGERQIGHCLADIAPDHLSRYVWAAWRLGQYLSPGAHVLDAACGSGYGCQILAQAGFRVDGVDRSPEALAYSGHFGAGTDWAFHQLDLLEIAPHPLRPVAVVTIETIEHIERDKDWVKRAAKIGDYIVATVPNEEVTPFDPDKFRHHVKHYTPAEFEALFDLPGVTILERWTQKGTKWESTELVPGSDGRVIGLIAKVNRPQE